MQSEQETDIHAFVPEYRRIAEAEANWLKEQGKDKIVDKEIRYREMGIEDIPAVVEIEKEAFATPWTQKFLSMK